MWEEEDKIKRQLDFFNFINTEGAWIFYIYFLQVILNHFLDFSSSYWVKERKEDDPRYKIVDKMYKEDGKIYSVFLYYTMRLLMRYMWAYIQVAFGYSDFLIAIMDKVRKRDVVLPDYIKEGYKNTMIFAKKSLQLMVDHYNKLKNKEDYKRF